jgi:hypothetical protein
MDRCPCLTPVSINVRILLSNSLRTIFRKKFLFLQQTVTMFKLKSQTCMSCSIIEAAINYYQQVIKPCLTTLELALKIFKLVEPVLQVQVLPSYSSIHGSTAPFLHDFVLCIQNWKNKVSISADETLIPDCTLLETLAMT